MMDEKEKMMAFHALQTIKEVPESLQEMNLFFICKMDPSGRFEKLSRILAEHKMPTTEIVPCLMDILQEVLLDKEVKGDG